MRSNSHAIHKQTRNRFGFSESWRISCGPMRNGFHAMLKIIENQTNCHKLFSICRNKINAFELNEVVINESSLRAVIEYVEEIPRKTIFLFDFPDMPTRLTHTNVACTVASVICCGSRHPTSWLDNVGGSWNMQSRNTFTCDYRIKALNRKWSD